MVDSAIYYFYLKYQKQQAINVAEILYSGPYFWTAEPATIKKYFSFNRYLLSLFPLQSSFRENVWRIKRREFPLILHLL